MSLYDSFQGTVCKVCFSHTQRDVRVPGNRGICEANLVCKELLCKLLLHLKLAILLQQAAFKIARVVFVQEDFVSDLRKDNTNYAIRKSNGSNGNRNPEGTTGEGLLYI